MKDAKKIEELKSKLVQVLEESLTADTAPETQPLSIPLSVPTFDSRDIVSAIEPLITGWPTIGPKSKLVEGKTEELYVGRQAVMVSSGGAANLMVLFLLTSPYARPEDRLKPGDEIITPAVTWATTVTPILRVGCVPVFADVHLRTYDIDADRIESLLSEKTRALMIVHPLGHACDMDKIQSLCQKHNLLLIEDTCESLGTRYGDTAVGGFGKFGTLSFYFSHHITSIEGGMILTGDDYYADVLRCMRSNGWFREIRNESLRDDFIRNNPGVDSSFLFPFAGYNFKPTDMAAGLLLGQFDRLQDLLMKRREIASQLNERLQFLEEHVYLPRERPPCHHGWFTYPMVIKENAPLDKGTFIQHLRSKGVDNRPIIAGNVTCQPFLQDYPVRKGDLPNADLIMKNGFFIGIHHKITEAHIDYLVETLKSFIAQEV